MNRTWMGLALAIVCGGTGIPSARAAEVPVSAIAPGSRVTLDRQRRLSLRPPPGWHRTRQSSAEFMGEGNPSAWTADAMVLLYTGPGDVPPRPENVRIRILVGAAPHASLQKCLSAVTVTERDFTEKAKYTREPFYPGGLEMEIFRAPARDKTRFLAVFALGFSTAFFVIDIPQPDAEFPSEAMKLFETLSFSIVAPEAQEAVPVPRRRPHGRAW